MQVFRTIRECLPAFAIAGTLTSVAIAVAKFAPNYLPNAITIDVPKPQNNAVSKSLKSGFTVVSVHDGDTIKVRSDSDTILKVRLACIDAPELSQPGGKESRDYLKKVLLDGNNKVKLDIVTQDRYGRTVAEVWRTSSSLGEELVQSRMAVAGMGYAYAKYKSSCPSWDAVAHTEEYAKQSQLGVWSEPNALPPWEYRAQRR